MKAIRSVTPKLIIAALLTTTLLAATAQAGGFFEKWHHRGGDMLMPIERMIDHLDLSDFQEEQVEEILKNARLNTQSIEGIREQFFTQMIGNNPDNSDYINVSEQHAEAVAAAVKDKVLFMANLRQEIYSILNSEQKEVLETHLEKKLKRMQRN